MAHYEMRKFVAPEFIFGIGARHRAGFYASNMGARRIFIVTDPGVAKIRAYLSEVAVDRIKTPLKAAEIPKLFTTETFCKMVIREQKGA